MSATTSSLIPELAGYAEQFATVKQDAQQLVAGLQEGPLNWRPAPGAWSIAECLGHLNIVGERYFREMREAVEAARAAGGPAGSPPFRYGFIGNWLVRQMEPPIRRRFKAPRGFTPSHGQPLTAFLPTFLHLQDQFTHLLEQANGLDLARVKVPSPATRLLKLGLGQAFALMAAHERRHLWQARQVRGHPGFPAA